MFGGHLAYAGIFQGGVMDIAKKCGILEGRSAQCARASRRGVQGPAQGPRWGQGFTACSMQNTL